MPRRLTTAETLVFEVLVAHNLLGAQHATLDRQLCIKPQLDTLQELGLVTWTYDEDANFLVTATDRFMSASEGIANADASRDEVLTTADARSVELAFGDFDEQATERLADDYGRDVAEQRTPAARALTVVIPSFNERDNVTALVGGLEEALRGTDAEILYVDDSTDDTADVVRELARTCRMPLRVLQREEPRGGLAGAVRDGMCEAKGTYIVVMDADLQHPPALVPVLLRTAQDEAVDLVVASRYCGDGAASGLSSSLRQSVSSFSTVLARTCFPRRVGRVCSDPMTGFFCVRRASVDLDRLRPRGFKILLEILARHELRVAEVPFTFGLRASGESKASWRNGGHFLLQMAALRMGRMSRFAAVGVLGTLVNLAVMWFFIHLTGLHYVGAAVVATEVAVLHNFLMQERYVFGDMRDGQHTRAARMAHFFAFNNVEMLVRTPLLVLLVSGVGLFSILAQGLTLAAAFLVRFCWVRQVVYRPRAVRVSPRRSARFVLAGWVAVRSWFTSNSVRGRLLSALRPASRPSRQALQLSIPVAITLVAFPGLPVRMWHLLSDGGRPAAILLIVTACAVVGIALRVAPAPGEPDVHDRQLDVILAVPFVGGCVWLVSGWPEQFGIDPPLTGHQVVAATALLAGTCLLVVGTRLSARLRFVLLLPLIAMPQVTGRPAVLVFLVTVTIAGTLLAAMTRYRWRDRIAASGSSPITHESTGRQLGSPSQVEAVRAPSMEEGVSR